MSNSKITPEDFLKDMNSILDLVSKVENLNLKETDKKKLYNFRLWNCHNI